MSYPGYPSYPQGPGQQPSQPGPPMYQTAPLSYPIYPGSAAPQPQQYQYGSSQYPSSAPTAAPYPQQTSPYPQQTSPYPQQTSPYPSSNTTPYPNTNAPYPSSTPQQPILGQPPQPGMYPPAAAPYPSIPTAHTPSSYPTATTQSSYPQTSPYPQQHTTGYPSSAYPGSQTQPSNPGAYASIPSGTQGYTTASRATPLYSNPAQFPHSSIKPQTPTVRPANPFNARQDAEVLRKAMKGFGTDEKALINILTNRTNVQRQQIAVEFKTLYGKDLISDIKSEVSGNFEAVLVALLTPLPEFLAKELHHAVSGLGTNEDTIVEIICTATNYDIKCITAAYQHLYGTSLERDLAGDTSGYFRRLLISLCQGNRSEIYAVDQGAAVQDAQALLRAGELQLGTDESTFNAILCSRSYTQLGQIFIEYHRLTGNDFEQAIRNEFSGYIQDGLLAIVKSVRNKSDFFAEQLQRSMSGAGTKDRALIRIITARCDVDLGDIKLAYQNKYGRSLEEAIASETSGDYKKALISLLA